jgi:hypothetical protein
MTNSNYFDVNPGQNDDVFVVKEETLQTSAKLSASQSILGLTNAGNVAAPPTTNQFLPQAMVGYSKTILPAVPFNPIPPPVVSASNAIEYPKQFYIGAFGKKVKQAVTITTVA